MARAVASREARLLPELRGAPRVLVLTGPLFSPYSLVAPFTVLYMLRQGISPLQVGLITSMGVGVKFIALILGGYAADRWGRRESITLFDLLGFSASMAILSQARTFPEFLAAHLLGGLSTGSQAAWSCILVEEVPASLRGRVVTLERALVVLPSIVLPILAAALVNDTNFVPIIRLFYLAALASITTMVALRWFLMPPSGTAVVDVHRRLSALASAWVYAEAVGYLIFNRRALVMLLATIVVTFAGGLGLYYSVFVTDDLRQPVGFLGYLAAIGTAVGLLGLLPRGRRLGRGIYDLPMVAQGLVAAGVVLLLAALGAQAQQVTLILLLASVLLGGVGAVLWAVGLTLAWASTLPDHLRSKAMATQQALGTLAGIPSAALAGILFEPFHPAPWIAMVTLQSLTLTMLAVARRTLGQREVPAA